MEWEKRLTGRIVALDTAPLIYYVEGHPIFIKKVRPFFEALANGDLGSVNTIVKKCAIMSLWNLQLNNMRRYLIAFQGSAEMCTTRTSK